MGLVWDMADVCGARRIPGTSPWMGPFTDVHPFFRPGFPQQPRQLFCTLREWEVAQESVGVW